VTEHGYLEVKNFDQFQHYKQRNPPWIKLHAAMMDDYDFAQLPEVARFHLMGIWVLASKTGNKIPADPEWIERRINAQSPVDLELLITAGFVKRLRRASDVLAESKQVAIPSREEERREETEESTYASHTGDARLESTPHNQRSVMGLVIARLYFGTRPTPSEMASNADILASLNREGHSWDRLAKVVEGLALRRDRGELKSVAKHQPVSLKWVWSQKQILNQLVLSEDALYTGPSPPAEDKRGGKITSITDHLPRVG
jgi:hypothetical protein